MGARVGFLRDHEAAEVVLVLRTLGLQVVDVDVAIFLHLHHDNFHSRHRSRRRILPPPRQKER